MPGIEGFRGLRGKFEIESAYTGCINSLPESLYVTLDSKRPTLLDIVHWHNPMIAGKPSFGWSDFLKTFDQTEAPLPKHAWLVHWKKQHRDMKLHIDLFGSGMGKRESDLKSFVWPVWRHAGMKGAPSQCVTAHWGKHAWVECYFSDADDRAIVISASTNESSTPFLDSKSVEDPNDLEHLNLSWHYNAKRGEEYSKYAVIDSTGGCKVRTFVASENSHQ